jgi:uncharacterized protein (DUF433 family)/transposase
VAESKTGSHTVTRLTPHRGADHPLAVRAPCHTDNVADQVDLLEREMYSEAEAARLLRVSQSTLHYWLEGGERRGHYYMPVIRHEPTDSRVVTWAEFVEAGLLRQYRRVHGIPMVDLRRFIDELRQHLGVPYPLAHEQPWFSGRELLAAVQEQIGLDGNYALVTRYGNQYLLTPPGQSFIQRVEFHGSVVAVWRPHSEPASPVIIDPDVRFGRPSVRGISTAVLYEHSEDGESPEEIAKVFGLRARDVRMALSYESAQAG